MSPCTADSFVYTVQPGDTLWLLAKRFHTTIQAIISANSFLYGDQLLVGQTICIPQNYAPAQTFKPFCFRQTKMTGQMLNNHLRMLWEQHVYWTRLVILGIAFDLPDVQLTSERLLRNPSDFEVVLKLFYGGELAAKFAELFTAHLTIAAELVKAAKAGNHAAAADAEKRWYTNADQIAAFLAGINPYWSQQEWKKMLYDHLEMTKMEAVEILTSKYADSIHTFDNIEREALLMADLIAQGIIRQFPLCFSV
jgi:LysM repeat protein